MDKAYEDNNTRFLAQSLNFKPIVPPKSNRKTPWIFDKVLYKSRNNIERLFRKIKRFRRIFTRYDKLDSIFLFFIYFAFIFDSLLRVNRPQKTEMKDWDNEQKFNWLKDVSNQIVDFALDLYNKGFYHGDLNDGNYKILKKMTNRL